MSSSYAGYTGASAVEARIRAFALDMGIDLAAELIAAARLTCVSLARSTQPYGIGPSSQAAGEKRTRLDIYSVFTTPGVIYQSIKAKGREDVASAFWNATQSNNRTLMATLLQAESINLPIVDSPDPTIPRFGSSRRGRNRQSLRQIVVGRGKLAQFVAQKKRNVGFAKAGFAQAADDLGGHRGIPLWASGRHRRIRHGHSTIDRSATEPLVEITNSTRYIDQILDPLQIIKAIDIAYDRILKKMTIATRARTRAFNRRSA
jgi:hypothetical protein